MTRVLVFDSGLGGLTVLSAMQAERADLALTYVADDALFPYGNLSEAAVVERVVSLMEGLIAKHEPALVVIACSTASTLVLGPLRQRWPNLPFVGTVPAIKPAALASRSKLVSVLATPGTVARDYTKALVREFAGDCEVTLVGAPRLASLAEAALRGEPAPDADIAAEIAPAFVERGVRRTDQIVLACTHFPLLAERILSVAPWRVHLVDPAPAIARRVDALAPELGEPEPGRAYFTSGRPASDALQKALLARGLTISSSSAT